jgi:hypothetical protein
MQVITRLGIFGDAVPLYGKANKSDSVTAVADK